MKDKYWDSMYISRSACLLHYSEVGGNKITASTLFSWDINKVQFTCGSTEADLVHPCVFAVRAIICAKTGHTPHICRNLGSLMFSWFKLWFSTCPHSMMYFHGTWTKASEQVSSSLLPIQIQCDFFFARDPPKTQCL